MVASFLVAIPQLSALGIPTAPHSIFVPNAVLSANQPPTANFTFTPANPTVNTVVSFDGHLSNDPDGAISGWRWNWGDGTFPPLYSSAYETHTFLLNATFTVTLTVTDSGGLTATASADIKVQRVSGQETPPASIFAYTPAFPLVNQAVTFDASASRDSDGDPVTSYNWYIGDGTNYTQTLIPTLTHTFVKTGVFSVSLTVTDNHGMSSTSQVPALIGVTRIPYVPGVGQGNFGVYSVSYNQPTAVQGGGQIVAAYENVTRVSGTNVTINFSVLYSNGTFSVVQGTTDVQIGGVRLETFFLPFVTAANLIVGDPFLPFSFGYNMRINETVPEVVAGAQRMVNVASIQISSSARLTLKYDQATGLLVFYSVSTVYGAVNSTTSLSLGDTNAWARTENAAPLPLFSWSPDSPTPGTLASFDASHSYDPDHDPISYQWQFGDGSSDTGVSSSHTYISSGIYNVMLIVSDLNGGTTSSSKSITIGTPSNQPPIPTFTFTPTNPSTGQAVTFDATASRDPDGTITNYAWNFGDGQTGTGITTAHGYNSAGIYNVALNVIDNGGATGSVTHTITVVPTSRVGALRFNQGENFPISAVNDPAAGFAYFGTFTTPGSIVKVQLSDFTRVGSLTLNASEGNVTRAVIDTAAGFAYFGTASSPGVIVKIRLSNFTRVGSLALNAGENYVMSAAIDPAAGFAYFGTYSGAIVKVSLSNFTRVGSLTLSAPEYYPLSAVIDSAAGFAYFGTYAGFVVKVRLSNFTRVGSLALNPGQSYLYSYSAVIDTTAGFAYFSTYTSPSIIVKVRLSDLTRVGSLTLNAGEDRIHSAVIDSVAGFAYFGTSTSPGLVVRIRLSNFTRAGSQALNADEYYLDSAVIDPAAGFAYFGTYTSPGIIVKVDVSGFVSSSPPSAPSGLTATLGVGQVSLSWIAPSSNGGSSITGYRVYRGSSTMGESFLANLGNVTSYTDMGISTGQSYYYQVSGLNSAGEGPRSNEASVMPAEAFARVGALTLNAGENQLFSAVMDPAAGFAYFSTFTSPSIIVKIRLSDLTRVGSLTLNPGENNVTRAVIDTAAGYAYFGTDTSPGIIVKIRLSDLTRVGNLTLNTGENHVTSAVIDTAAGFAYFGTYAGSIVKVRLSDFTRVGSLTLNASEYYPLSAVIDSAAGFAYFGTYAGFVVKVRLSDLTRVGSLALNTGENILDSAVIDTAAGYAYFGTYTSPGIVVKVRLSDLTRVGSLALNTGENIAISAVIDSAAGFAYFGTSTIPGIVVKVRLSDFTRVGSLTLNTGENYLNSAVIDSVAGFAYFGTYTISGIIVKVKLSASAGPSPYATSTTLSCTPSIVVINQATSCIATVTDTALGPTTPTGTVTFTPGGTCSLSGAGASATCSVTITPAATGPLSISASYGGDASHATSSGATALTVNKRATTTAVSCALGTVVVNIQSSCTATVADTSPGAVITPTGSVGFSSSGTGTFSAPSCTLSGTGASASCSVNYTPTARNGGTHTITGSHGGDASHNTSFNTFYMTVTPRATTTAVTCNSATVVVNQQTMCSATATDTSPGTVITPSGTVSFTSSGTGIFSSSCTLGGTGASASCNVNYTPTAFGTGTHTVTASYAGDTAHQTSSGSAIVTVNLRTTTTTVACTPTTVVINQGTSCAATVADTSPGTTSTPSGTFAFTPGGTCTLTGTGISATCSVSIPPTVAGSLSVSASYPGDTTHAPSTDSTTVTVTGARAPDAPVGISSSAGNGKVTLSWSPPANDGGAAISGYNVYRAMTSGGEVLIGDSVAGTSYTDAGLTNGQKYYYKVSAVNSVGEGSLSLEVTATPTSPPVSQSITSGGVTFNIASNSTISNLQYDATSHQISFQVSGIVGTGVANMTVPKSIVPSGANFNVTVDSTAPAPNISQDTNNYYVYVTYPSSTRTIYISFAPPSAPEKAAPNIFGLPPSIFTAILGAIGTIVSAIIGLAYRAKSRPKN
ncbi:hypothetical protein AUG19_08475 [archaeon 13_1_20CM_2_54_9]|nr:MAG: hypothetical protein AUG19_08475 [archaeon 13_1_20CM_2_54_9]